MRIILLNLPWRENNRFGVRAGSRWPFTAEPEENGYIKYIPFPFFLATSAALLKSKNNDAKLIDAIAQGSDEEAVITETSDFCPDLIVIETSTPSFDNDMRIACRIKERNNNSFIAVCGPHASTFAGDILDKFKFIDYVLIGEYEYTLADLSDALEKGKDLCSVLGLAFRSERIRVNRPRPAVRNLDDLPWPDRQIPVIYKYNDGFAGLPVPNVQMYSSRGCPFRCVFCLWPQVLYGEHKYRKRNPLKVIQEMDWLIKEFDFKAVYFDDDVFNIDKTHVKNICGEIKKRNIRVPWAAMARADLMDEGLLSLMADSGLYAIKYGVESANRRVLGLCKKNLNLERAKRMIKHTKKSGVKTHLTFCLGLPGETEESVQDTVNFIAEVKPDSLQFSLATPFPGTAYSRILERSGIKLSGKLTDYDGNSRYAIASGAAINLNLEKLKRDLCNNFNLQ